MPLPTTVVSTAGLAGHNPPHKSSGGNFYVVVPTVDTGNQRALDVYKATDPTDSWTVQDTGNRPQNQTLSGIHVASVQDGDVIHIAWMDLTTGGRVRYNSFNMATDAWVVTLETAVVAPGAVEASSQDWVSIAVRSGGDVILAYNGERDRIMGGYKERVDYARREGGTWTSDIALDAAGDVHYGNPVCALGTNDGIHIAFGRQTGTADPPTKWGDLQGRTLDSANGLSTVVTTSYGTALQNNEALIGLQQLVSYDDGGTQRIVTMGAYNSGGTANDDFELNTSGSVEDGNDDVSSFTIVTPTVSPENYITEHNGSTYPIRGVVSGGVDGTDLHLLYSGGGTDGVDQDVYHTSSTDDGATWGTPVEQLNGVTCNFISAAVYMRGPATVLGYFYDDGGSLKYNEYEIDPGNPNTSELPSDTLTLTGHDPQAVTSDNNIVRIEKPGAIDYSRLPLGDADTITARSIPVVTNGDRAIALCIADSGTVNFTPVTGGWGNALEETDIYAALVSGDKALTVSPSGDYDADKASGILNRWVTLQYSLNPDGTISHVGSESFYRDNGGTQDGIDIPITHSIATQAGDVVVVSIFANKNNVAPDGIIDNNPSFPFAKDFQAIEGELGSITGVFAQFSRVAGAIEPGTYNFELDGGNKVGHVGSIRVYRNVDNADIYAIKPGGAFTLELVGHAPTFEVSEAGETSQLPSDTLTLTGHDPSAATTEKHISLLAAASLAVTAFAPQAVTTENNISLLESETLTLADFDPQVVTSDNQQVVLPGATLTINDFDPTIVITENNISALESETLTLADFDPQAVTTENNRSNLPSDTLTLADFDPQAVTTEFNISELESEALTLTGYDPTIVTAQAQRSLLDTQSLVLADFDPQAVTTENNISALESEALTLTGFAPTAETFDPNTSQLPSDILTLTGYDPEAVTTEGADSDISQLPSDTLILAGFDPQAVTTEFNISELPSDTLTLANFAPDAVTFDPNTVQLPSDTLTLTGYDPEATTTEGADADVSQLPSDTLTLAGFDPQAVTTENHISELPSDILTLAGFDPSAVTFDPNTVQLPSDTLALTGFDPQAVTTEGGDADTSQLPSQALTLTGYVPQAVTTENHISELPSDTLTLAGFDPLAVTFDPNTVQLPSDTLTLADFDPQAVTTENNISELPSDTLTLTSYVPQAVTTENNYSQLPSKALTLTAYAPLATNTEPSQRLFIIT